MIKIGHKFNIKPTHCFFAHIPNALKKFSLMKLQHFRCSPYTVRQCLLEQSASLGYIRLERGLLEQLQHDQPWEYKTVSVNWCLQPLQRKHLESIQLLSFTHSLLCLIFTVLGRFQTCLQPHLFPTSWHYLMIVAQLSKHIANQNLYLHGVCEPRQCWCVAITLSE